MALKNAIALFENTLQVGAFVDATPLITEVANAVAIKSRALDQDTHCHDAHQELEKAIAIAEAVIASPKSEAVVEGEVLALKNAIALFENTLQVGAFVDATPLITEVANAVAIKSRALDQDTHCHDAHQELEKAIAIAEAVIASPKSEAVVEGEVLALKNAIALFENTLQVGAFVDATPLITEVANAVAIKSRALDQDTHCHDAHQELEKAIAIAEAVIASPKSEAVVEGEVLALKNAIALFENTLQVGAFVDATPLITEVANAVAIKSRALDQDTHCHDAHQELEKAIAIAEAVIASPKSEAVVEGEVLALKNAIAKFEQQTYLANCQSNTSEIADGVAVALDNGALEEVATTNMSNSFVNINAPLSPISRASFATVMYAFADLEHSDNMSDVETFSDIGSDEEYAYAIKWAVDSGIYSGYADGTFRPDCNISREQLAVVLFNFAKTANIFTTQLADISGYADANDVSSWALLAVKWAINNEILLGRDHKLEPTEYATRAEVAFAISKLSSLNN
ncbi:S-layer homology domain-containing protein [Candidatus Epulonipiscium viviparus]|uniref:S-layer homology domain-containing protein n=1 Tax=Candidatus Epulonipiscium viviparus TaxID=420336 RepID=UPI0027381189|nr:S-layer homology domain-containing protein [Candidatus Epulopiscium viviparus]